MAVVLLVTSVASLFMLHRPRGTVRALYEPYLIGNTLALSFQSVAEIWKLAVGRRWGQQRCDELDAFLRRFLIIPTITSSRGSGRGFPWRLSAVVADWKRPMRGSRQPPCTGASRFLRMIVI